jgi:transcriptional regulator with GAF, ATPase, and Fis domain
VGGVQDPELLRFRFISATNRPLAAMVERGEFRKDLYWRLNVFSLRVPALRERPGDIALLARYFLRRANPRRSFTPMAQDSGHVLVPGQCCRT